MTGTAWELDEEHEAFRASVEGQERDLDLLRATSELVVHSVVEPTSLHDGLVRRLSDAKGWERAPARRHHPVTPV